MARSLDPIPGARIWALRAHGVRRILDGDCAAPLPLNLRRAPLLKRAADPPGAPRPRRSCRMRNRLRALALFLTLPLIVAVAHPAHAAWPNLPAVNLPVSLAANYQFDVHIVSDGAGGVIM